MWSVSLGNKLWVIFPSYFPHTSVKKVIILPSHFSYCVIELSISYEHRRKLQQMSKQCISIYCLQIFWKTSNWFSDSCSRCGIQVWTQSHWIFRVTDVRKQEEQTLGPHFFIASVSRTRDVFVWGSSQQRSSQTPRSVMLKLCPASRLALVLGGAWGCGKNIPSLEFFTDGLDLNYFF